MAAIALAGANAATALIAADTEVKITFLPPPMKGTISLGVYDKSGALVRSLCAEATDKDFVVGLNGLVTSWDGKNDAGQLLPPGKYSVRGYTVGDIEVDGVAFHCNDWISEDDFPRIREVSSLLLSPEGDLIARARTVTNESADLRCTREGETRPLNIPILQNPESAPGEIRLREPLTADGNNLREPTGSSLAPIPGTEKIIAAFRGRDRTVWVIDATKAGTEVKQFSSANELLRRLTIPAEDPQPTQIVACSDREAIYLLARDASSETVRGLALEGDPNPDGSSQWKVFFSRTIRPSGTFAAAVPFLGTEKPPKPEQKFRVRLLPNPLFKDAVHERYVRLGIDPMGALLLDADGLPLRGVTSSTNLKWAVMVSDGPKTLRIYQSDGSVVEEFKARKLANMMSLDAGTYELKASAD